MILQNFDGTYYAECDTPGCEKRTNNHVRADVPRWFDLLSAMGWEHEGARWILGTDMKVTCRTCAGKQRRNAA